MSGTVSAELDYVLLAFPNHPQALIAMAKLGEKLKVDRPPGAIYMVPCYFERAVRFRPDDGTVRMLYATWLSKRGKPKEAVEQLQAAEKLVGQNANLHYNMGLAYLDLKDYGRALDHAHHAYQLGFPLPGLKNRLERAGQWREPQKVEAPKPEANSTPAETTDKP